MVISIAIISSNIMAFFLIITCKKRVFQNVNNNYNFSKCQWTLILHAPNFCLIDAQVINI